MSHSKHQLGVGPAFGRDYKSKKAIQADLDADMLFRVNDIGPWCGQYVNASQAKENGITHLSVRYKKNTEVVIIKL